jgi:hypothetical protein
MLIFLFLPKSSCRVLLFYLSPVKLPCFFTINFTFEKSRTTFEKGRKTSQSHFAKGNPANRLLLCPAKMAERLSQSPFVVHCVPTKGEKF